MNRPVLELKSSKTAAEIEALGDEPLDIRPPLTVAGWKLVELASLSEDVTVTSADGAVFIGSVSDVDEGRYVITVELR